MSTTGTSGRFSLGRVHSAEWLVGIFGLTLLVSLLLPWNDGGGGPNLLGSAVIFACGLAGAILPFAVGFSRLTNVPVIFETLLWTFSLPVGVWLVVALIIDLFGGDVGGNGSGFWLALFGVLGLGLALWRSVQREL